MPDASLEHAAGYWIGRFQAMASPCEVLMEVDDAAMARRLLQVARTEALRIEQKFSRYRTNNIIHQINHADGRAVQVDEETAALLDYAGHCHQLSDGMFDITSGILRTAWHFDGSDHVPQPEAVAALLPRTGWDKVSWRRPHIRLPPGMEIDFGGIGKEYAVDRSARLLRLHTDASLLVNYGGDLYATGPRRDGSGWVVGVESPRDPGITSGGQGFQLTRGGIATSGDARRFLLKDGIRYSHILDPRTGWPVRNAPRSVTVVAGTCTDAGILATLAMLHGPGAEDFLRAQGGEFWCQR